MERERVREREGEGRGEGVEGEERERRERQRDGEIRRRGGKLKGETSPFSGKVAREEKGKKRDDREKLQRRGEADEGMCLKESEGKKTRNERQERGVH